MYKHSSDLVKIEFDGEVAIVTMNDSKRRNPFSLAMRIALSDAFRYLFDEDKSSRSIVLIGAGGHFCSGGDLSGMASTPTFLQQRANISVASELVRMICSGRKPVLAAVEGSCIGAGLSLACAADIVIAGVGSKLSCAFVKVGLIPDTGIMWTLGQRAGHGKARELMLSGAVISVADAFKNGIVDQVVADGEAMKVAVERARALAQTPPDTLAFMRRALVNGMNTFSECCRVEADFAPLVRKTTATVR